MRRLRREHGWTLIELMIVMVIIVILASIGLVQYGHSVTRAKEATLAEDLFRMRDALDQYYADKNKYPASLEVLVEEKYLRDVPPDPFTQTTSWDITMSEPEPGNPSAEPGVYNVHSTAEGTGLNGKPYTEW